MGFSSENYYGMQYNPIVTTIEGKLFNSKVKNGWIPPEPCQKLSHAIFLLK